MLSSAALGYAACVGLASEGPAAMPEEQYFGAVDALRRAALEYAASRGSLDAKERAELIALRRFKLGALGMYDELADGRTQLGEPITSPVEHVRATFDAMLDMEGLR